MNVKVGHSVLCLKSLFNYIMAIKVYIEYIYMQLWYLW